MYGEDKTSLEELKNTVNELQSLKIEILPKADKTSDLNNSIEKMENQIKQVDENLLNNTKFATTGNETATENATEEQQQEIKTSENSNLNILISNIDTLTEKVNQAVKVETERKAKEEEERKAREEEEKKQKQSYVGTYKNSNGNSITITENGKWVLKHGSNTYNININNKNSNGSIRLYKTNPPAGGSSTYYLYPVGVAFSYGGKTTNSSKSRIYLDDFFADSIETAIYYKVD